jgi:hypothetical protein
MEILLVVATLVVGVAVLYVTATFSIRTRQNTAPLIDAAAKDISGQVEATTGELRRQLQALADELRRDRDQARLEERKIQGRLDHTDSRIASMASQLLAELETLRRLSEQIGGRQDQLSGDLRQLDHQVAQLAEATVQFPPVGHAGTETAAEAPPVVAGQFYAERLRFSIVRIPPESFPRSERQFRILIERYLGELPSPHAGNLGDASAIAESANRDEVFRERLGKAASDYLATKGVDRVFAAATERWVTRDTFPQTALADACHRLSQGLEAIVERPPEKTGTEIRLPGLEAATAAGIGPALILQPVTEPLGEPTMFLEITGVVVGMAAGLHPLALAAAKTLAHDQFHDLLARSLRQAARQVFGGQEGPAEVPGPARLGDETAEVSKPVIQGPGSTVFP